MSGRMGSDGYESQYHQSGPQRETGPPGSPFPNSLSIALKRASVFAQIREERNAAFVGAICRPGNIRR